MTVAEYLAIEESADYKSEFYNGEMFAMASATRDHDEVTCSLQWHVGNQLRGGKCREYSSNMRVKAGASGFYTYPDLSIVRGEPRFLGGCPGRS